MSDIKKNILLLFDRPLEPCFMQKGDEKAVFEIPEYFYPDKYKNVTNTISNRFSSDAGRTIPVTECNNLTSTETPLTSTSDDVAARVARNIALPNLSLAMELPYNAQFSLFVPKHRTMAGKLIDIFMGARDLEELQSVCTYCQLRINPYMFNYCLSVAILHRPDTKDMNIPTFAETFPDKFMDPKVFRRARQVSSIVTSGSRMPILIPKNFTADDSEPEQRLAYFREDIGVNLHHWHWHLVYPYDAANLSIVNKDRRGELFYYMHQQIIARYTMERMCNGMGRIRRYHNFREPIEEGYFPKLFSQIASRVWASRFSGTTIQDLDRPAELIRLEVADLETMRDRFVQSIETLSVTLPDGRQLPLDEETGIDHLGNMMESSIISPNRAYYGDLHNMGHLFISLSHDPDFRHLETFGVMSDSATAMRDPIFYRWHAYIDDLFALYKYNLTPYGDDKLGFSGIDVSSIHIEGGAGKNMLETFWEISTVDISRGLDFTPRGSLPARFTHLQHQDFNYVIEVNNTSDQAVMGTLRVFMAPTVNESGVPLLYDEQRRFMIELDKFTAGLKPGKNTIRHRSLDSSVTIPYERTFRDQSGRSFDPTAPGAAQFDFCGCGWPHHMLIAKGTPEGFPVVLFVMVSNWNDDKIEQDLVGSCNDAASYCGIRDRRYPDRRAMGFPFDRPAPSAATLGDFLRPNMAVCDVTIRFSDTTRPRQQR